MNPLFVSYFIALLISCLISLLFIKVERKPSYLNYFFIYPTLAFFFLLNKSLASNVNSYQDIISMDYIQITYNFSFILHFYLLGLIIKRNIETIYSKKVLDILFYVFIILITFSIFTKDLRLKNGIAYGITNSCLIIFCLIYYFSLFKSPPTLILLHSPAFWIINGIFFGMITTIPINFSGDIFLKIGSHENIQILKNFGYLSYITMHLFFIKGYLCTIRPHKVL